MSSTAALAAQRAAKRAFDVVVSAEALLVLLPVMAGIAIAVKASSPGEEIIFRQPRAGLGGRVFTIYKFRTMNQVGATPTATTRVYEGDARIGRVGRFLRRTSLDELPQLANVLRGEMSIVGPRPDLPHHAERYTAFQRRRLAVRPGITGWAQVRGRNRLSWDQRIELDVEYLDGWTLGRDAEVLARSVGVVVSGRGETLQRDTGS